MGFKNVDKIFLSLVVILTVGGFFIFSSASLGLLTRSTEISSATSFLSSVAFSQFFFGIVGGTIALLITSHIHYRFWRKYAFYIFLFAGTLTLLVFSPLGFEYGGARRWLHIAGVSFQPAELLKIAFMIYMATWLSGMQKQIADTKRGTLPFFGIIATVGAVMLAQPDTDTFLIMAAAATAMFLVAGGRWRDVGLAALAVVALGLILIFTRPYIKDRVMTFFNPELDAQGAGWQINQSLIAIGSGGFWGNGYGQSVQKFGYLPEPISDSIFAVYAEEFGFLGSLVLLLLFAGFTFRGLRIASHAKDQFGMLLVVGLVTVIAGQAFLNIAAMAGLLPLGGLPLPFISHGGTALLTTLAAVGIILNVSKHQKRKV